MILTTDGIHEKVDEDLADPLAVRDNPLVPQTWCRLEFDSDVSLADLKVPPAYNFLHRIMQL